MSAGAEEDRIVRLEETVAHQQATIEEMSRLLTEHWKLIERLGHELRQLSERFEAVEDQAGAPEASQKPPHW